MSTQPTKDLSQAQVRGNDWGSASDHAANPPDQPPTERPTLGGDDMQPFRYSTPAEQTSPLVSSDPTPAAPSLQAVAEGAAREIENRCKLAGFVLRPMRVDEILTRHFAPLLAERDERIKEMESVDEKRLEVIQRYGEEVCALRTRVAELEEDKELWEWAATHPEETFGSFCTWWATAGRGSREIRFEFRNIVKMGRDAARKEGEAHP